MYFVFRGTGAVRLPALFVLLFIVVVPSTAQIRATGPAEPLTGGEVFYMNPSWAPDGGAIAFTGARYEGIYVLDLASGATVTVTDEPAAGFGFEWAPDGEAIVARVARFDGSRRLNAVKVFDVLEQRTGESLQVSEFRTSMPAVPHWDARGSRVYLYSEGRLEIFDTGREVGDKDSSPTTALIAADDRILKADLSSETVESIRREEGAVLNLKASPDGSRVAYEQMGGNLFSMSADGSVVVDLGPGNRPSWSPDGEWIAFTRSEDDGHEITVSDLYAVRADGSGLTRITSTPNRLEMNPSWSPDGTRIAYDDAKDGFIYLLPISR